MKIIILQDHKKLGSRGDITDVADGYARNYLIPKRIAAEATDGALRAFEHDQIAIQRKEKRRLKELEKVFDQLEGISISFTRLSTEDDKLYGAVGASDIAEMLAEKGFALEKRHVILEEPIKELGVFPITIRLYEGKETQIQVWIVKEQSQEN